MNSLHTKSCLQWLLIFIFSLQSLIPAGFMLNYDAKESSLQLVLCPGTFQQILSDEPRVDDSHHHHNQHHKHHHHHLDHQVADAPTPHSTHSDNTAELCPFAVTGVALAESLPLVDWQFHPTLTKHERLPTAFQSAAELLPPSRGPPLIS